MYGTDGENGVKYFEMKDNTFVGRSPKFNCQTDFIDETRNDDNYYLRKVAGFVC